MRVLIVEDETLLTMLAEDVVESCGYAVVGSAATYPNAMALAAEHKPDAALVDLNLLDGFTRPEIGIALAERFGIKVLFVTANVEGAPVGHSGVIGVLGKPYSPRELGIRLNELAGILV
jgi:DNA-binding response OmpR family regulator